MILFCIDFIPHSSTARPKLVVKIFIILNSQVKTRAFAEAAGFTLKTFCKPSGVGSLANTLFSSSCRAASVSLYSACRDPPEYIGLTAWQHLKYLATMTDQVCYKDQRWYKNYSRSQSTSLHLSLLGVERLLFFSFLWSVRLSWQTEHTVDTHL